MNADNVTTIHRPPERDRFDEIYDRMQEELSALQCVRVVLDTSDVVDPNEDLAAARSLLHHTFVRLDELHSELANWRMETSAEDARP